jgi:hypothetical protein
MGVVPNVRGQGVLSSLAGQECVELCCAGPELVELGVCCLRHVLIELCMRLINVLSWSSSESSSRKRNRGRVVCVCVCVCGGGHCLSTAWHIHWLFTGHSLSPPIPSSINSIRPSRTHLLLPCSL